MPLIAIDEPGQEMSQGIRFTMGDGGVRVNCWVSCEALDGAERGDRSQQERAVRFDRHRVKIEQVASQKYDAGEHSPIVMSFDLGTLR
jgi:hypothetical protein